MNLKTLNDIEKIMNLSKMHSLEIDGVCELRDNLRQEAIKEIKKIGSGEIHFLENGEDICASEAYAICQYIKWKNNITEDELK